MWQHLEKHKQRYGLAMLALAVLWLAIGYLGNSEASMQLPQIVVFVALIVNAAFLYVSGVTGLIQGIATIVISVVCLLFALAPDFAPLRILELPKDLTYTIAIILFLLLTFLLQLPKKIKNRIVNRSAWKQESVQKRTLIQNDVSGTHSAVKENEEKLAAALQDWTDKMMASEAQAAPYQRTTHYRQALFDMIRSWSLVNISPLKRWLRLGLALAITAAGVILIQLALQQPVAADFFRSTRFTLIFIGSALFLYAIGLLGLGWLRGLSVPAVALLVFYGLLGVIRIEQALIAWPLLVRLIIILLFLTLYIILFYYVIRNLGRGHDLFNWIYQKDLKIIGVDIALKDMLPIDDFTMCLETTIQLPTINDGKRLRQQAIDITAWYQHRLNLRKIIPVGFIFEQAESRITFLAYCKVGDLAVSVEFCQQILEQRRLMATVEHKPDPYWDAYLERLFPDAFVLQDIINIRQLDLLAYEGVDLQTEQRIRLGLRFIAAGHREAACQLLQSNGFAVFDESSFDPRRRRDFENDTEYYLAFAETTTFLTRARLNAITGLINQLVKPFGGVLFGWEVVGADDSVID